MAFYSRIGVLAGETLSLRALITDLSGNPVNADSPPVLYIYDTSVEDSVLEEELDAETYTSAIAGPLTSTLLSTGYYEYEYEVPTTSDPGVWKDIWIAEVNGLPVQVELRFTVEETVNLESQSIGENTLIMVEIREGVLSEDGLKELEPAKLFYTTTYSPLYASPDMVLAEVGPWIQYIPNDTLALIIHWSSKEADFIQIPKAWKTKDIEFARARFVVFDAALKALMQPGAGNVAGFTSGGKKQLGDLMIDQGSVVDKVDKNILDYIRKQRDEWWRVVNAGGNIVPGQGLGIATGVKGGLHADHFVTGRLWDQITPENFPVPLTNTRVLDWKTGKLRASGRFKDKYRRR